MLTDKNYIVIGDHINNEKNHISIDFEISDTIIPKIDYSG